MATLLLIDDDSDLLDVLSMAVEDAGHQVLTATDGITGMGQVLRHSPALIVSDVNMPGLDGLSLCKRLRDQGVTTPIILLTSRDNEVDEALGLELGADDYVAKPFSTRVLIARISALLRRQERLSSGDAGGNGADPGGDGVVTLGPLSLDAERLQVRWRDTAVRVTVTEFRMLQAFAQRPGIVLSRDRLLDLARGDDSVVAQRIIDTYIRRLRKSFLAADAGFDRIETVIGAGYRWRDDG